MLNSFKQALMFGLSVIVGYVTISLAVSGAVYLAGQLGAALVQLGLSITVSYLVGSAIVNKINKLR